MTYSLTPTAPSSDRNYRNAAETFLFDTQEGYCVQYATAAAMLLRALDIPTRYAEGYIADKFEQNGSGSAGKYISKIPDGNAHAWIEVFYEGFGWVSYEVTAPFVEEENMSAEHIRPNGSHASVSEETSFEADVSDTVVTERSTDTVSVDSELDFTGHIGSDQASDDSNDNISKPSLSNGNDVSAVRIFILIMSVLLTAAAVVLIIVIHHKAVIANSQRNSLIHNACRNDLTNDDTLKYASELGDAIMRLLAYCGFTPIKGELANAFALRVDTALCSKLNLSFANILPTIQEGEFAITPSLSELKAAANYYTALYSFALKNNGRLKAIYIKYFLPLS